MKSIVEFSQENNLNPQQTKALEAYIIELLVDNLKSMKQEYNEEIDKAITSLTNK